jgi:hypothetical protein
VRFVSWDRKEGIEPDKLVLLILRNLRLVSLAIAGWSGPVRFGSLWNTRVLIVESIIARELIRCVLRSHSTTNSHSNPCPDPMRLEGMGC